MGKKVTYLLLAVLVLGPVVANAASLGPVGWWRFDEKTGTTAADSSPNKNNGTINGGAAWTPGQIDGAVLCDGNNDYVSLPIGSVISKLTSATFAVWTNYSQQGGAWQRILDFGTGETVNMFLTPAIGGSNTGVLRFAITTSGSGGESQLSAANRLVADWHHVAVVINGDSRAMQMFLDGEVVANGSTQVLPNALGTTTNNWLGRSNYAADAYYSGALDDFRIYDRALSQSDIKTVMKGGGYGVALGPQPVDRETDVSREVMMTWIAGQTAKTHDVYLGTDANAVEVADVNSPVYWGRRAEASFSVVGVMQ